MEISLLPVKEDQKDILSNLYQFYEHDFSEFTNQDVNNDGKYDVNINYFWKGDHRWHPYIIDVSGVIAGFTIVLLENLDTDPDPTHVIHDFMVLKKFRRKGIGKASAIMAFEMYKANWKIVQMETNIPAISFWRNLLKSYTNDNYTEIFKEDKKKYIQTFSTKHK
jgi:predicted acetyltransferase